MSVQIIINGENAKESLLELSTLAAGFGQGVAPQLATTGPLYQQAPNQVETPQLTNQQGAYAPPVAVPTQTAPTYPAEVPTQPAAVPSPGAVPISTAPSFSIEQIGVAAGPLVDAGRGPELTAWLNQKGAAALTQLDKSFYGEFATYLRSLGAKI